MKRVLAMILALGLALGGTAALAEGGSAASGTLVVANATEMSGNFFSEMFGNNTADLDVRMLLHGYNLMMWEGTHGAYDVNPTVVKDLKTADDAQGNRTYTLTLWSDLVYSDGTAITAADYAFSMLLSLTPEMEQIGAQTVYSDYVVGSDAYRTGASKVLSGVRLLDNVTLQIKVKAGYAPYFYEMGLLNYQPYPIHVIAPGCKVADHGDGVDIENMDLEEEPIFTAELLRETMLHPETGYLSHPTVVSGAYTLDSYDPETRTAAFSANPYFKGDATGAKPEIERLIYRHISPERMIEALSSGEVDLLNKCAAAELIDQGRALTKAGDYAAVSYPRSGYSFVSFSCERPVTGSELVRKAIAHCMDKQAMVANYVGEYGVAVDGYYGIGQWVYRLVTGAQQPLVTAPGDGASAEELRAYHEEIAAWDALSLDQVKVYAFDLEEAVRLLERDGWTLNRDGGPFDPAVDDVRCKAADGELLALELTLIYPEGNAIADALETGFLNHLAQVGILATAQAMPMPELLEVYYRTVPRECDMIYLASNFATVFDPSYTFSPEDAYQGISNNTGIVDEALYQSTVDLRATEPGDLLTYCRKWITFQQRWAEVLPNIPIYSNVYYDFYTDRLENYLVTSGLTWSEAIIGARLREAPADGN